MYEIGQIFTDDEEYSKRAEWCNANNCYIDEITQPDDVVRQFQIKEIPAPTDEELAQQIRAKRNSLLFQTDYLMMPDYPISDDKRKLIEEYRQALRDIPRQSGFPRSITWPEKP